MPRSALARLSMPLFPGLLPARVQAATDDVLSRQTLQGLTAFRMSAVVCPALVSSRSMQSSG
jgi:hypothetical protein